jgi:hypothetical protein
MKTVWGVFEGEFESTLIELFSAKELAERFIEHERKRNTWGKSYDVEELSVYESMEERERAWRAGQED